MDAGKGDQVGWTPSSQEIGLPVPSQRSTVGARGYLLVLPQQSRGHAPCLCKADQDVTYHRMEFYPSTPCRNSGDDADVEATICLCYGGPDHVDTLKDSLTVHEAVGGTQKVNISSINRDDCSFQHINPLLRAVIRDHDASPIHEPSISDVGMHHAFPSMIVPMARLNETAVVETSRRFHPVGQYEFQIPLLLLFLGDTMPCMMTTKPYCTGKGHRTNHRRIPRCIRSIGHSLVTCMPVDKVRKITFHRI